ncbi:MAG: Rrf2 family transcriptional regulator [Clostridia bacterium]|nr:Rrf2 family transcriptional regulator [Clostridia bacterium]
MISTKGRYALRFMMDLAEQPEGSPVTLDAVSARQNISKKYLEIIVKILVKGKLVKGTSGKGGGYRLLRSPEEYSVGEILELTEGTLAPVACLQPDAKPCDRESICKTIPMWREYHEMVNHFFYSKKLTDLLEIPDADPTKYSCL